MCFLGGRLGRISEVNKGHVAELYYLSLHFLMNFVVIQKEALCGQQTN